MGFNDTHKKCIIFCSAMNIYLGVSVGLNVYNKYILNTNKYPLFLLTCQFFFLFCASGILIYTLLRPKLSLSPFWITKISFKLYFFKLLPIGFLYGSDYIFSNIAIANGPLAFVQMIKAGVPLIVLFYKIMEPINDTNPHKQPITSSVIVAMVFLCCGQLLIYFHEVEFSWICFIFSAMALIASGTKIFVIEKLLKKQKTIHHSHGDGDANNNNHGDGAMNKQYEDDEEGEVDDDERSAFIGIDNDTFSPAQLILTDSDNDDTSSYFYDVEIDHKNSYKENVELQIVETNKKNKVKIIKKQPMPSKQHKNGILKDNKNKKDLNFFRSVIDKLSLDNIDSEDDEIKNEHGNDLIEKERQKVAIFTEDIPLNETQKLNQQQIKYIFNQSISSSPRDRNKKQKMHSMLALFYFMPISWLTALFCFVLFEYPQIKNDAVFSSSTIMINLLSQYVISGIIALALNWCELFMIKKWNALSFCIFGAVKLILVLGASWICFNHSFTFRSLLGYFLCIIGVCCYNYSQIKNKKKVKKDLKQILKAFYKSIKNMKCIKQNKRKIYKKIWSDFPMDDPYDDDYSDSSSSEPIY